MCEIPCFMIAVVKRICPHMLTPLFIPQVFAEERAVETHQGLCVLGM